MNESTCMVWLPADHRCWGQGAQAMPVLVLGQKYAYAVQQGAKAQPVVFPLAQAEAIEAYLSVVDGVMLTGSPSNVHPAHFEQSVADEGLPLDPARDALTLALVRACVQGAVPLLGVCRGFQEMNVALGGTLHQQVHAVPGLMDHREPETEPLDQQYASRHCLHIAPGSVLQDWAGGAQQVMVNSLHGQGIDRLGQGLAALAHAPDGLVEAFAVQDAPAFAYGVQFHPEWHFWEQPFYAAIFQAFGQACRQRHRQRNGQRRV